MKSILLSFILGFFLAFNLTAQDIDRSNYQLLWEITGNGFESPSYLFGSMHVEDKRVFDLPDSMLVCLENCEGFSGELNMDSMVVFILEQMFNDDSTNVLKQMLSPDAYNALNNKLLQKRGEGIDDLDNKQPWIVEMLLDEDREEKADDFESFLDMYLYNYAKKLGKKTYGLEKIEDQLNLSLLKYQTYEDYLISPEFQEDTEEEMDLEELTRIYISGDINEIDRRAVQVMPDDEYKKKMLTDRNIVMAENIELLGRQMPMFNVVGAAHLPGKDGVIALLRNMGYNVRPVTADFTGKSQFKNLDDVQLPWATMDLTKRMGCELDFPVRAVRIEKIDGESYKDIDFYMSMDIYTEEIYFLLGMTLPEAIPEGEGAPILYIGLNSMFKDNDEIEIDEIDGPNAIEYDGMNGLEVTGTLAEGGGFAGRAFLLEDKVYYLYAMRENDELVNGRRFFESLKVKKQIKETIQGSYEIKDKGIAFVAPVPMEMTKEVEPDEEENISYIYKGYVSKDDIFYSLRVDELQGDEYIMNQNASIEALEQTYLAMGAEEYKLEKMAKGEKVDYWEISMQRDDYPIRLGKFFRGNRHYSVIIVTDDAKRAKDEFDEFIKNIEWLDLETSPNQVVSHDSLGISIALPQAVSIDEEPFNEYPYNGYWSCSSKDWASSSIMNFEAIQFSSFYEISNEVDSFLLKHAADLESDGYEMRNFSFDKYLGYPYVEVELRSDSSNVVNVSRMVLAGNKLLAMTALIPKEMVKSDYTDDFFNSLKISSRYQSVNLQEDKASYLLESITTTDSLVYDGLWDAIDNHEFEPKDVPLILSALKKEIPLDTLYPFYTLTGVILSQLEKVADKEMIPEILELLKECEIEKKMRLTNLIGVLEGENTKLYWDLLKNTEWNDEEADAYTILEHIYEDDVKALSYMDELMELSKLPQYTHDVYKILFNVINNEALDWEPIYQPYKDDMHNDFVNYFENWTANGKSFEGNEVGTMQYIILLLEKMYGNEKSIAYFKEHIHESEKYLMSQLASALLRNGVPMDNEIWRELDENLLAHFVIEDNLDDSYGYSENPLVPKRYKNSAVAARLAIINVFDYDYNIASAKLIQTNKIKHEGKPYLQYVFELISKDYPDEPFIGVCIQPGNKKTYKFYSIYSEYKAKGDSSVKEMIPELMEYFEGESE